MRCVLSNGADEYVSHIFLECEFTWRIWCTCLKRSALSWVILNNLRVMFKAWIEVKLVAAQRKSWSLLFFVVIWSVRNLRNKVIFDKGDVNLRGRRNSLVGLDGRIRLINLSYAKSGAWNLGS